MILVRVPHFGQAGLRFTWPVFFYGCTSSPSSLRTGVVAPGVFMRSFAPMVPSLILMVSGRVLHPRVLLLCMFGREHFIARLPRRAAARGCGLRDRARPCAAASPSQLSDKTASGLVWCGLGARRLARHHLGAPAWRSARPRLSRAPGPGALDRGRRPRRVRRQNPGSDRALQRRAGNKGRRLQKMMTCYHRTVPGLQF